MAKSKKKARQKKIPDIKCRLCGETIQLTKWRKHLEYCHNVGDNPRMRDFYIGSKSDLDKAQREWYNPKKKSKIQSDCPCGTVIGGPPKVKIIYNSIFSNRKKF